MSIAKCWTFTLNNYTDEDDARLQSLSGELDYIVFGREVGDSGTRHLQGFLKFSSKRRMQQVKNAIGGNPHVEVARNPVAAAQYCKKDGDYFESGVLGAAGKRSDIDEFKESVKSGVFDIKILRDLHSDVVARYPRFCFDYISDHIPAKEIEEHPFRGWQEDLNTFLNRPPDDRTIVFCVDLTGNSGKSWFCHFYAKKHERVQVMQPGKKADMAFALDPLIRVLFVDAPRSKQGEFIQYDFLEDVKNGYVFSPKYESRVKQLNKCHVVVMMNEYPDMTKLSQDRFHIIRID